MSRMGCVCLGVVVLVVGSWGKGGRWGEGDRMEGIWGKWVVL